MLLTAGDSPTIPPYYEELSHRNYFTSKLLEPYLEVQCSVLCELNSWHNAEQLIKQ